jgi:hypothetical protein
MPGPLVIQKPELPASINPQGVSVFDTPGQGILRKMVSLLGLDDPQQIMGVGAAMDVGPMGGGLLDAAAKRFPRFAAAIKAYHGSPHDFEAFDTSKIGTGEGAQAYGHGLYFAENPQVAADYRKQLSGMLPEGWGSQYPSEAKSYIRGVVGDVASGKLTPAEAAKYVYNANASMRAYPQAQLADELHALAESTKGKTYEVGINAHPDQFLDWDKPFSQQTPEVQDAVTKALKAIKLPEDFQTGLPLWLQRDPTGESIHAAVSAAGSSNREGQAIGSARLKDAGIPGIKYLDQGSRGWTLQKDTSGRFLRGFGSATEAQTALDKLPTSEAPRRVFKMPYADEWAIEGQAGQTRNFVVFDAKTVDILKKYGLLLPAAGAGLAASQQGEQP